MRINSALAGMPAGYLFATIAAKVRQYEADHPNARLLRLGIGDVTLPLSQAVVGALSEAAFEMSTAEGFRGYGPDGGYDFLREAIVKHDYAARGVTVAADEVFISDGAKTDTSALQELFAEDVVVAVTDPVYPVYVDANAMAGRLGSFVDGRWEKLVYLPCNRENGFVPPLPEGRVDVIYLCYPNNPTGTMLTREQLQAFVDYARENEALIIYDAAYKAFVTQDELPLSIYEIEGAREVAIECCSFSKTAGFTGLRCAWTVVPKELMGKDELGRPQSLHNMWKRRSGSKSNGVAYPVQRAAAAVYSAAGRREVKQNIRSYLSNAQLILRELEQAGIEAWGGRNAPYVWLKTPRGLDSWAFFDFLLKQAQVVGTPGAGFGPSGEGYFRLTAFNTYENTKEALERIRKALG